MGIVLRLSQTRSPKVAFALQVSVRAGGGRPVNVTFNVTTPDVAGFQRSQRQIAATLGRALARGERNA